MASNSSQSASKAFNERTPYSQIGGIAHGAPKIASSQCEGLPALADAHWCVFYRKLEAYAKLRLRRVHRIAQHANTGNTDLDRVSGKERTYPRGRTGGDNVAGHQGHHAGDP